MEWWVILVLALVIPLVIVPVGFIWYVNIRGLYDAVVEGKLKGFGIGSRMRIGIPVLGAVGVYGFFIWFLLTQFGWPSALGVALGLPVLLVAPVLIWVMLASGLYEVVSERLRRRVTVSARRVVRT